MTKRISNKQRSQETTAQLVAIARKLFSTHGYAGTSLEEIVRKAGMTRGALYHHFEGKKGIFAAVFESALTDIANRILVVEKSKSSIWDKFISCTYEFYNACLSSELQRIVLIDGPAVLGWDVWRSVDEAKTLDILRSHLRELLDRKIIKPMPLEPLTHLISGAVNESVSWIAVSEDPKKTLDEAWSTMEKFLGLLRI